MVRLARFYVSNPVVAEEAVQEARLAVIRGLGCFEGRCSLKTWIFRILINIAITRGQHESRSVPFSSLVGEEGESFESTFDAGGAWVASPDNWGNDPEEHLLSRETQRCIQAAIAALPTSQREVIALRDVVTDYLEGVLLPEMHMAVTEHLMGCPNCSAYYAQMQGTIAMLRQLAQEPAFPEAKEALPQKFREWHR